MQSYCTLYIVRHAETEANAGGILGGDTILTAEGEEQAESLRKTLKDISFDAVYVSDLVRTRQTAEIFLLERDVAIQTTKLIRERSYGSLEGTDEKLYTEKIKAILAHMQKMTDEERMKYKMVSDMESEEETIARFIRFIREVAVAHAGKNVLVISHGNIMRVLLVHLGFAKYSELPIRSIENTGYIKLKSDGVDFFIEETVGVHKL